MARWQPRSLEEMRELGESIAQSRGWEPFQKPRNLVMNLVAEVGRVSETFQWRDEANVGLVGWSEAERRKAAADISDVLIATIRLADVCAIDLGEATMDRLEREMFRYPCVSEVSQPRAYSAPRQPQPQQPPRQSMQPQYSAPVATGPPAPAAAVPAQPQIQYSPPAPQPALHSPPPARHSPQPVGSANSGGAISAGGTGGALTFRRPAFSRTLSVVAKRADPQQTVKLYSPTHFDHGLFAPFSTQTDFEVKYGNQTTAPPLPKSISQGSGRFSQGQGEQARPNTPPLSPLSPRTLKSDFFPMIKMMEHSDFSPQEFQDLELTYCIPHSAVEDLVGTKIYYPNENFIDLKPQGKSVRVTLADRHDFTRLAFAARARLEQGLKVQIAGVHSPAPAAAARASPPPTGNSFKRPGLKRTLSVALPKKQWDPEKVAACYSPGHFEHGVFSPHAVDKDFEVDYSAQARTMAMPRAASKKQLEAAPPQDLSCLSPKTRELETDFDAVMQELENMAERGDLSDKELEEFGIFFNIPYRGQTYDLIPNGSNEPVRMETLRDYITLARERKMHLDRQNSEP